MTDILHGSDGLHGAHTYQGARAALGGYQLRLAVEAGELVGFGRGVLLDARRVLDLRTRCAGALLLTGPDGVVVGPTAAALHGCTAVGGFPVHVKVPYSRRIRSRSGLVVHQGEVRARDVTVLDGLRVLPLDLAVAEVLCVAPRRTALACVDQAMRGLRAEDRSVLTDDIAARLAGRVDRRGTKRAGLVLSLATGLPESPAQSAMTLILADAGLPRPVCQYEVCDRSGLVRWRLDFAWPELRVALEYEGEGTEVTWDRDPAQHPTRSAAAKEQDLSRKGWLVLHADVEDLADATLLLIRLRSALNQRRNAA
jgi:hypothetical protein